MHPENEMQMMMTRDSRISPTNRYFSRSSICSEPIASCPCQRQSRNYDNVTTVSSEFMRLSILLQAIFIYRPTQHSAIFCIHKIELSRNATRELEH